MNLCHGSFFDQDFRSWAWTDSLFSRRLSSFLFYASIEVKNDGIEVWKEESGEFLGVSCFCGSDSDCMDKLDNYRYGRALFVFSMSPLNKNWKLKNWKNFDCQKPDFFSQLTYIISEKIDTLCIYTYQNSNNKIPKRVNSNFIQEILIWFDRSQKNEEKREFYTNEFKSFIVSTWNYFSIMMRNVSHLQAMSNSLWILYNTKNLNEVKEIVRP